MATQGSTVFANVILVLLLVAVVVMGSFWIYRQMGTGDSRGSGVELNLGGGNGGANGY